MVYGKKLLEYQKTSIETSSGLELIIMCYDHAVRFLKQAKEHYKNHEYLKKGRNLQRALGIINELKCSLDFEKGEEIARNLDAIYNFLIKTLLKADIQRKLEDFDHAIGILEELKDAWEGISKSEIEGNSVTTNNVREGKEAIGKLHAGMAA